MHTLERNNAAPAPGKLASACLLAVGFCLGGYAFLGRSFAYIGLPPVYVDFFLWMLCVWYLAVSKGSLRLFASAPGGWLGLFMLWGGLSVLEGVGQYGMDALRDGVLWAYGLFGVAVAYLIWRYPIEARLVRWYGRWMVWLPPWILGVTLLYWQLGDAVPALPWGPGGGVPLVSFKGGDMAVHLAGLFGFWLLMRRYVRSAWLGSPLFLLVWTLCAGVVFSLSRSAFVTILAVFLFLLWHGRLSRWATVMYTLACVVVGFVVLGVNVDAGFSRSFSLDQVWLNILSIFQDVDTFSGTGSKHWRLEWWRTIVGYTFGGDYFWLGKGCGINLATDDGFQVLAEEALRSPHNGHMTVLARTGVPGLMLWLGFLGAFAIRMRRSYLFRLRLGQKSMADLRLWITAYVLAGLVNASFDVYLEGPQGGIWIWCLIGLGLGLTQRDGGFVRNENSDRAQSVPHRRW